MKNSFQNTDYFIFPRNSLYSFNSTSSCQISCEGRLKPWKRIYDKRIRISWKVSNRSGIDSSQNNFMVYQFYNFMVCVGPCFTYLIGFLRLLGSYNKKERLDKWHAASTK